MALECEVVFRPTGSTTHHNQGGVSEERGRGSRVGRVDVVDGHSAFNGAQCKASRLVLLVFEDAHSPMLILERTVDFLQRQSHITGLLACWMM